MEERGLNVATLIGIQRTLNLRVFEISIDSISAKRIWNLEWRTESKDLFTVQFDVESGEIVNLLYSPRDTDGTIPDESIDTRARAETVANDFLKAMTKAGLLSLPSDAVATDAIRTEMGWELNWHHEIGGVPVRGDYMSIIVDHGLSTIRSFYKNWRNVGYLNRIGVSIDEVLYQFLEITDGKVAQDHSEPQLSIVRCEGRHRYAWIVDSTDGIYWFDALTCELLNIEQYAYDKSVQVIDGIWQSGSWSHNGENTYNCANRIYRRLFYSTTSTDPTYYYEDDDVEKSDIKDRLYSQRVFFFIGHGTSEGTAPNMQSGFSTYVDWLDPADGLFPNDVTNSLANMRLGFIASCRSFTTHTDYSKSLCAKFIDKGAKYVFGWDGDVIWDKNYAFSEYFFDYAVTSHSLEESYNYAYGKMDTTTKSYAQRDCADESDKNYEMVEEDPQGETSGTAENLGTFVGSPETDEDYEFHGLWASDIDWFKFTITNTYRVELWVAARHGLDAKLQVYNNAMTLLYTSDSGDVNQGEHVGWFYATGTYYIKISHGADQDQPGGEYDLRFNVFS
ncbi:MAG: hypothetical protein P1Q69_10355 [Candidatus Thorarchaeota archaeon]|nr:hypothetical protein [Candidatus Thorarchaeota archaeon]